MPMHSFYQIVLLSSYMIAKHYIVTTITTNFQICTQLLLYLITSFYILNTVLSIKMNLVPAKNQTLRSYGVYL